MSYAQELKQIAYAADRQEQAIGHLALAYDSYMNHTIDSEPTPRVTKQLLNAVRAVIGLPPEG